MSDHWNPPLVSSRLAAPAKGGLGLLSVLAGLWVAGAQPIAVPNASFESPATPFVNTHVDAWQKAPKPDWYVESGGYTWDQLAGLFKNTPNSSFDHIANCDGAQALWLFVVPGVALFQDYDALDWANTTHAFEAAYEVGKGYRLTVGVIGGGGNMLPGASLELSLYYRDALGKQVPVAVTAITNSPELFTNLTTLIDFQVDVPPVNASDPWAGRKLGIGFRSTVSLDQQGGYWDLDNVRLAAFSPPRWSNPVYTNGQFTLTLQSEPGLKFEVLASPDPAWPLSRWASLGLLTNTTGTAAFTEAGIEAAQRFYRARQVP